jgi:hypothetical protein
MSAMGICVYSQSLGILTDFDTTAAFDLVLAGLSIATCQRMGLPFIAGHFMFDLLKNMNFHLVTGFGRSPDGYLNHQDNITGQGVLQGHNLAAPIFLLKSDISLSAYSSTGIGATFTNPIKHTTILDLAIQFADNKTQI